VRGAPWFGSEDHQSLPFEAVFDRIVKATVEDTPVDPTNLPE